MRRWVGLGLTWVMACGGSVPGDKASVQGGVALCGVPSPATAASETHSSISVTACAPPPFSSLLPEGDVPSWDGLFRELLLPTELLVPPLEVHEWGTFTSVQSPDGKDMEGLHHEEEPLPSFVHGRGGMC